MATKTNELSKQAVTSILTKLNNAIDDSGELATLEQLKFLNAISPEIENTRSQLSKGLCSIITKISNEYGISTTKGLGFSRNEDDDGDDSDSIASLTVDDTIYDKTMETTDEALDYFNRAMDDANGIQNASVAVTGGLGPSDIKKLGLRSNRHHTYGPSVLDIEKPQIHFHDYPIDNSDNPFIPSNQPKLKEKKEKDSKEKKICIDDDMNMNDNSNMISQYLDNLYTNNNNTTNNKNKNSGNRNNENNEIESPPHPYKDEIEEAVVKMKTLHNKDIYKPEENVQKFNNIKESKINFIETEDELKELVLEITNEDFNEREIAIDLEAHSVRSFQGFICLIQISTREKDYIIDALKLRGSIHKHLNDIFLNPSIVKVLHGADWDIQWLERDFGLYIVNMFDTGQACRLLNYSSAALTFLLSKFCDKVIGQNTKKKFQLADWRQRPLTNDMLNYARDDTHYLLYIYDRLRQELFAKDQIDIIWEKSATVCQKRFQKLKFNPDIAKHLASKHGLCFNQNQMNLLDTLCKWRDSTARIEDESLNYVAPVHVLYGIVKAGEKVRTVQGFFQHGFPTGFIPPVVREHAEELVMLICDAYSNIQNDQQNSSPDGKGKNESSAHANKVNSSSKDENTYNVQENVVDTDIDPGKGLCVDPGDPDSPLLQDQSDSDDDSNIHDANGHRNSNLKISEQKEREETVKYNEKSSSSIVKKGKSALLGSDSEESSDEEEDDDENVENQNQSSAAHPFNNGSLNNNYAVSTLKGTGLRELSSNNGQENKVLEKNVKNIFARGSKKALSQAPEAHLPLLDEEENESENSSLENSDSEDQSKDKSESAARVEAVSKIRESFVLDMNKSNTRRNSGHFEVETDIIERNEKERTEVKLEQGIEDGDDIEIEEVKSIRQLYAQERKSDINKDARKVETKKRKRADANMIHEDIEPFNYKQASRERKEQTRKKSRVDNKSRSGDRFDPMRKLKNDWKENRPRIRKRRKGKGKSMSFKQT